MKRPLHSHKGENGKVAVIGGSASMHGAPIVAALAAEAGGTDLIYLSLPRCHADVAKLASLNFQVHPFAGDDIAARDIDPLLQMLATVDVAVIGPGLSRSTAALKVIRQLIESAPCPLVLDASALQPWTLKAVKGKQAILTPHLGELERMGIAPSDQARAAKEARVVIHLKGSTDRIALPNGTIKTVKGGNAGLTVGGTGDALAGLIAGLLAQKMKAPQASVTASKVIKTSGDVLKKTYGFSYGTKRVIGKIPEMLKNL